MNPKIQKFRAEVDKNMEKISRLQSRNGELKQQIQELENLDIIGMVRQLGLTPEALAVLLEKSSNSPTMPIREDTADGK